MAHSKFPLFALLALLCAAVSGCGMTTTKTLSSDPKFGEEITRGSETDDAVIRLKDGSIAYNAYHVAMRADSTEWYSKNRALRVVVATSAILSVSIYTPGVLSGIVRGLEIGLIPSLGIGVAIAGFESGPRNAFLFPGNGEPFITNFAEAFGALMATFAIYGCVGGTLYRTEYKP
jgi:hypothetical protein